MRNRVTTAITLSLLAGVLLAGVLLAAHPAAAWQEGAVIATDYLASASVARILGADPWTITPDLEPVCTDAIGVWHDGLVWIVNRAGCDNIQVLDPAQDYTTIRQFSLGLGRNIQDIAFVGERAFVSCYDSTELLEIDPTDGTILDVHSTAGFADSDGLPETKWLVVHGERLLLTCERLDRNNWYAPVGDSYLLVFDTVSGDWVDMDPGTAGVQGLLLAAANPYARPVRDRDHLLVASLGYYGVNDGGVEVIDTETMSSLGLEVSEGTLGGDVLDLDLGPDGFRHVILSDATFATRVVRYTISSGGTVIFDQAAGYDHADIAFDGDFQLFVADRTLGAAGVRVFDALSGAELTSAPLSTGLPPAWFVFPSLDGATPVLDLPSANLAALDLSAPWPNPANPATNVTFAAPAGATVELRVVDLRGRLVRRTEVVADADGRGRWTFDGRDGAGRAVASGVYRVIAETPGGGFAARSLTLVR